MLPAVITDEISQDFEHALDVMREYGVRHAELRGLWGVNVVDLSPELLERARRALEAREMAVCAIASPLYKCRLAPAGEPAAGVEEGSRPAERSAQEQPALLERAIARAEYFQTGLIRVFSGWKDGPLIEPVEAAIAAALVPAVRRAEAAGVVLALENEPACFLGTGAEVVRVIERIASPALRAVWDPGNSFFAGVSPFPDDYAAVRPYVAHVHVKDAVRGPDGAPRWCVVGEGELPYAAQLQALRRDGYQGFLSLESHYRPSDGDREAGSRRCLEGLLRLLQESGIAGC